MALYSFGQSIATVLILSAGYGITLVIYRLIFHPLASFPGPKLAAATRWYEFYYDILKGQGGQFALEIDKMHEKYGPIVRINPEEIHIKDSDYYSTVYIGPRHKYGWAANMVGAEESSFGTKPPELHRMRRSANVSFLSKRSVLAHEHVIVDAMQEVIRILKATTSPIDIHPLLLAFTTEVVWQFSLKQSSGLLDDPQAQLQWRDTMHAAVVSVPILKQFSWIMTVSNHLPTSFLRAAAPPIGKLVSLHRDTTAKAQAFLDTAPKQDSTSTIFHAIYNSPLPASDKTAFRLSQEAFTITAAAGNTTTHHLVWGIYFLVSNPSKLKLFQEALHSLPDAIPSWTDLSSHPYIRATIKEVLRLRAMTAGRTPLMATEPLRYDKWVIPSMTPISLTVRDILLDPKVYKDPMEFEPERWLSESSSDLDRYFVPFAKGARNCQGLELAWAELYIGLGALFKNFDFELVDLDYDRDLKYTRECLISMPGEESKSVRVKVTTR